ncbi:MAG TPA: tetratricopeptide repeat protein [Gemmatimonadaceae bacterium]|nr:tetratricopeptide repeat protein [Gemmatimonadaceae bacterium]
MDRALEAYVAVASSTADPDVQAQALARQADVHRARCDWDLAIAAARAAQQVAAKAKLSERVAEAIIAECNVLISQGDFAAAMPKMDEVARSNTNPRLRAIALQNIGSMHAQSGAPGQAERAFRESLAVLRETGYERGEAIALNNLGRLALDSNDAVAALPLLERAFQLARDVNDSELAALAGLNLASALCIGGNVDRAQDLAMAALGYFADCENRWREIECLRLIGDLNLRAEDLVNASRCYELARRISEQIGSDLEARASQERIDAVNNHRDAADRARGNM